MVPERRCWSKGSCHHGKGARTRWIQYVGTQFPREVLRIYTGGGGVSEADPCSGLEERSQLGTAGNLQLSVRSLQMVLHCPR